MKPAKAILIVIAATVCGCSGVPADVRHLIGVYGGDITYTEEGREPYIIPGVRVTVTIFSDLIPTSSPYRAEITIPRIDVPGVRGEYIPEWGLTIPTVTTRHNIGQSGKATSILKGETTADIGFPIPFPVVVSGMVEDMTLSAEMVLDASFGRGKKITFTGKKKRPASMPVRWKNLRRFSDGPPPLEGLGYRTPGPVRIRPGLTDHANKNPCELNRQGF